MHRTNSARRNAPTTIALGTIVCIAIGAFPALAQDEPGTAVIPTVYRDAYTITIKGKPDANGTFTMVFKPHGLIPEKRLYIPKIDYKNIVTDESHSPTEDSEIAS